MLNVINEYTREGLAIRTDPRLNSTSIIDVLSDLFVMRGIPRFILSDNGPKFIAQTLQDLIAVVGVNTSYITLGSPWENGYCERFNAGLRDELLNGEIFYSLDEAKIVIELEKGLQYKKTAFIFELWATSTRKSYATAPVCAPQTRSAGRLRLGKQPCLKLTFN